jgi:rhodanese-related sulfurtransferase
VDYLNVGRERREIQDFPQDRLLVFVCQGGRRSSRAAYTFSNQGYPAKALEGGMLAWENSWAMIAWAGGRSKTFKVSINF